MKSLFCFLIFACTGSMTLLGQGNNVAVMDPDLDREVLIEYIEREGLYWGEFLEPMKSEYASYVPGRALTEKIAEKLDGTGIVIVLGTWCHDSKIQVPRFLRTIDESGYDQSAMKMIGVDRSKKAGTVDLSDLDIERVPTFIFFRDGEEIGRIVESPEGTLEEDIYEIIQ